MNARPESMSEILGLLHERFRNHGDKTVLSDQNSHISYIDLLRRADGLSRYLAAQGIKPGDRVALLASPGIDWGIAFFGVLLSGAILVPLDTLMSVQEMREIITHAEPSMLISTEDFKDQGADLAQSFPHIVLGMGLEMSESNAAVNLGDRSADDVMAIMYTSGTTGAPKGIMATYNNLLSQ
ncbi:MAG: AMP-binding protein, partial [Alphaproteobacteria bacterium]|nr:AMP-binding protein [Alphaproteobacteria bacterium]